MLHCENKLEKNWVNGWKPGNNLLDPFKVICSPILDLVVTLEDIYWRGIRLNLSISHVLYFVKWISSWGRGSMTPTLIIELHYFICWTPLGLKGSTEVSKALFSFRLDDVKTVHLNGQNILSSNWTIWHIMKLCEGVAEQYFYRYKEKVILKAICISGVSTENDKIKVALVLNRLM